jgi:hypothetical protein
MLYRVNYKDGNWFVGNAECTEEEALEWIARRWIPTNEERAQNTLNAIKKNSEREKKE